MKCREYSQFNILCQSCDYPNDIKCSKRNPSDEEIVIALKYLLKNCSWKLEFCYTVYDIIDEYREECK